MAITKILYHPFFILLITLLAIIFFFSLDKSGKKIQHSAENIKILEKEVEVVSNDLVKISEDITLTDSEQYQEKMVRNELLIQKPGEFVLQIPDLDEKQDSDCRTTDCEVYKPTEKKPIEAWIELLF